MGVDPFRYVSRYVLRPHMGDHSSFSDQSTKKSLSLPKHLQPWARLLGDTWPADAGSIPVEHAVDMALRMGEARRGFWPSITVVIFV